jgi:hypothetical protein
MTAHSESIPSPRSNPPEAGCPNLAPIRRVLHFIVAINTPAGGFRAHRMTGRGVWR